MQAQMAQCCCDIISTHALTEGDSAVGSFPTAIFYFNSRPHGGRRITF